MAHVPAHRVHNMNQSITHRSIGEEHYGCFATRRHNLQCCGGREVNLRHTPKVETLLLHDRRIASASAYGTLYASSLEFKTSKQALSICQSSNQGTTFRNWPFRVGSCWLLARELLLAAMVGTTWYSSTCTSTEKADMPGINPTQQVYRRKLAQLPAEGAYMAAVVVGFTRYLYKCGCGSYEKNTDPLVSVHQVDSHSA